MTNTKNTTGIRGALAASLLVADEAKEEARRLAWDDADELTQPVEFGAAWDPSTGSCTAEHGRQPMDTLWSPREGIVMQDGETLTYARALIMNRQQIAAAIRPMIAELADSDRDAIKEGIHT